MFWYKYYIIHKKASNEQARFFCDLRFGIYDLRNGGANSPSVAEGVPEGRGSNIEVRFTIEHLA